MKKRKIIATSLAVVLAVALLAGGTITYLTGQSEEVNNTMTPNMNTVELHETDGSGGTTQSNEYSIVPGTSASKDPVATVSYTLDSYVYITVDDRTADLVDFSIDTSIWTQLDGTDNVWYRLVTTEDVTGVETNVKGVYLYTQELSILTGDAISYSRDLTNADMTTSNGDLIPELSLNFQAYIIQADISGSDGQAETALECWQALAGEQGLGVAAIGATLYDDVSEAILALDEGETLTLLADATTSTGIAYSDEVPTEYTIDLNGYTLTLDNAQMQLSAVENIRLTEENFETYMGFAYDDSYADWLGYLVSTDILDTDVTIGNGTIEVVGTSGRLRLESGTTLTLSDVTFTTSATSAQRAIQYYVSDNTTKNTITVTGCTFDNTYVDICGSSNNGPYEVTATFTDCNFTATPGNGGGCVTFDKYIYGNFTFTDCDFDVTGGGNSNGAIVINSSSSYVKEDSVDLTLNNVTFTGTTTGTYEWNTYTPYPVRISNTSVVKVTDNKDSVYSYMLDDSPVTYDGQAITVEAATAD